MSNEDDEFLRMAEECGATTQNFPPNYSTITFHKTDYLALCKKVQDKQYEKDVKDHQALCDAMIESIHKSLSSNQIGIQSVESLKAQIGFNLYWNKAIRKGK
jgi:hypothetical protein